MAQISQMTNGNSFKIKEINGITAPESASPTIVKGGNANNKNPFDLILPRVADDLGLPFYSFHIVMVRMIMANRYYVRTQPRKIIPDPLAIGICDNRPFSTTQSEARMSVPSNLHKFPPHMTALSIGHHLLIISESMAKGKSGATLKAIVPLPKSGLPIAPLPIRLLRSTR